MVHKAMLYFFHPFWSDLLSSLAAETEDLTTIVIPDYDVESVEKWLDSIYLSPGEVPITVKPKITEKVSRKLSTKPLTCQICSKSFKSKASLYSHKQDHRPEKWRIKCKSCSEAFKTSRHLAMHNAKEHGEKSLTCVTCGKSYSTDANLRFHVMSAHSGDQFACEDCGKVFASKVYLKSHRKLLHSDEANAKACPKCSKVFKGRYYYQHVQLHSPSKWKHECRHCLEKFQSKYKMLEHESLSHTGHAKFQCEKCDQMFLTSARRAVHRKSCTTVEKANGVAIEIIEFDIPS